MTGTLVSLFDASGVWSEPFAEAGWKVVRLDLSRGHDLSTFGDEEIERHILRPLGGRVTGLLAAPPCTDFTVSGAQYWPRKDATGVTERSVRLVERTLQICSACDPLWWALENPPGRLGRLVPQLGPYVYTFQPFEYAGWVATPEDRRKLERVRARPVAEQTEEDRELIKRTGAYTKRTCIWGRGLVRPEQRPIDPVRSSSQGSWIQRLGGTSKATKAERSVTPRGFAEAFAVAQMAVV